MLNKWYFKESLHGLVTWGFQETTTFSAQLTPNIETFQWSAYSLKNTFHNTNNNLKKEFKTELGLQILKQRISSSVEFQALELSKRHETLVVSLLPVIRQKMI